MALLETVATAIMLYLPPPRFDHPFEGEVELKWVTSENILEYCPGTAGVACVIDQRLRYCRIAFNVDYMIQYDIIMRHEQGHCNGWPSDHSR